MNAPAPDSRLIMLAQAIDRRSNQSALEFALSVGRMLIEGLYGGNLAAWRARGSADLSFRRLARLTQVSASVLYRSAAIYEMSRRMDVTRWGLPMSHLRAVISLGDAEQHNLLTQARRECWTVRRLEQECAQIRQQGRVRPVGRPPSPALIKGLTRLRRAVSQTHQAPITAEALARLSPEQLQAAVSQLDEQLSQLTDIRARLAALQF